MLECGNLSIVLIMLGFDFEMSCKIYFLCFIKSVILTFSQNIILHV